ncbi:unnamed protein product [Ceratitis capitata]|uniref:(Mediterranean fruit fly) hypothetical protein n=1 Tax=Ceratitis capitata TaxID=7213 RepID=A0A811UST2_CERCA|nr:unnamed protein product [Ceratitis capitata]
MDVFYIEFFGYDEPPPHAWTAPPPRRKCCIEGCISSYKCILYSFPNEEDIRKQWALACKITVSATDVLFICQRHFEKEYISKFKLKRGAFPCLNLEPAARTRSPSILHSAGSDLNCLP